MARQVVFRPEAEGEVVEARSWYEGRRAGLGREFAQAIDEIVNRIVEHPLESRFPYAVYYQIHGEDIVVQAVHGRQHPSRWRRQT